MLFRTPSFIAKSFAASLTLALLAGFGVRAAYPGSAQEGAALAEMANLETAITIGELDTTYFVSLESLNDLLDPTTPAYNGINNGGGARVIDPLSGQFRASRVTFNAFQWFGPYANFQPGRTQVGVMPYDEGSPLDPWGNPYLLYSPLGLLRGDTGAFTQEYYGDAFDRYAIVSLGFDGVKSGDDLIRLFNGGVTRLGISSLSGADVTVVNAPTGSSFTAPHAASVTLKGRQLGATQGTSKVFFGATELTGIGSWSNTSISITFPEGLSGSDDLYVTVGLAESNHLELTLLPNAVAGWEAYP